MNKQRASILCIGFTVILWLAIAFVFLPAFYNLLPIFLIAVVAIAMSAAWRKSQCSQADASAADAAPVPQTEPGQTAQQLCSNTGDNELAIRLNRSFGPIAAGLIIDLVDFSTFGPIGLVLGLPVGGLAGYWMGRALGLEKRASVWCALCAAIYCTIPGTEFIPLATIIGAYVRFRQSGKGS